MYKKPVETGMAEASSSASCCSGQAYEQASSFSIWHKRNTSFSLSSILQYLIMTRKGKNSNKNKSGYRDIGLYQHLIRGVFYIICSELYISIPILPVCHVCLQQFHSSRDLTQPICVFQYLQEKEQRENYLWFLKAFLLLCIFKRPDQISNREKFCKREKDLKETWKWEEK